MTLYYSGKQILYIGEQAVEGLDNYTEFFAFAGIQAMKIRCCDDSDTRYIELAAAAVDDTCHWDGDTQQESAPKWNRDSSQATPGGVTIDYRISHRTGLWSKP